MLRPSGYCWRRLPLDRVVAIGSRSRRPLSSTAASTKKKDSPEETEETQRKHPQDFVRANLSPGEWDIDRKDPYFRPKPHPRSNLISAEDFANRPPVGFDGEFSSYREAMISLSWMDQKTCKAIYEAYCNLMVVGQSKFQTTSHEYVTRVIAEKYHITTTRAAGIIQLQHAEAQMQQHSPELLCNEEANHAEEMILQNIRDAYKSEMSPIPGAGNERGRDRNASIPFIEDPVGIHGKGEPDETSGQWALADDIYDMEQKLMRANKRDEERAQILIDNHLYKEDEDERQQLVKADASGHGLLKSQQELQSNSTKAYASTKASIPYPEINGKGEKRDRWKYVAQIVNTRKLKKANHDKGRRRGATTSYVNNHTGNTLVEQNGELRISTVAEAKETAWKPTRRRSDEYLYQGVKKAWLEKTLQGKTDVWGRPQTTRASDAIADKTAAVTKPPKADAVPAENVQASNAEEEVKANDESEAQAKEAAPEEEGGKAADPAAGESG